MDKPFILIRPSDDTDIPAITAIYAGNVLNGTGTFETAAPDDTEMSSRRAAVLALGWPWLVAEETGLGVIGYAYANQFRPRMAYRCALEDSVYLAPSARGRGIGRALLTALVTQCEQRGARQLIALIGDADNAASIGLHTACGFERTGTLHAAGWKFDRWLDVVLMQRALGDGHRTPPGPIARSA